MSEATPTIAVINSNEDTTEMLRAYLQSHGFTSIVLGHVPEIKRGENDFIKFLETHNPRLFVWDVGLPYEENWRFVHMLMALQPMQGRRMVLTTTNKRALESLVGETDTIEIVGKPYDLEQIVRAVRNALGEGDKT